MNVTTYLNNFFHNAPNAFIISSNEGLLIEANQATYNLFGYNKEELKTLRREQLIQYNNYESDLAIRNESGYIRVEAIGITKGNKMFPIEIFSWLISSEGDETIYGTFIVDITHRKDMESAINNIYNISNDIIGIAENGYFQNVNPACLNILGYTQEELCAIKYIDIIHPDDLDNTLKEAKKVREGNDSINFCNRYRCKNGKYKWLQWNICFIQEKFYFIAHDVDQILKEKEQLKLLTSAIENTLDSIVITDADALNFPCPKILFVNDAILKSTGYSREELIGQTPSIFHGPKTSKNTLEEIHHKLKEWESCEVEIINYKKNGEEFWVSLSIVPIANEQGVFTHCVSVQKDITQQKLLELQLEKTLRINKFVSTVNELVLRAVSEDDIIKKIADIAFNSGGFIFTWLGKPNTTSGIVEPIMTAGNDTGYLSMISQISIEDVPNGRGISGKAYRSKKYYYCNDMETDEGMMPWRLAALKCGFHSAISLPIILNNEVIYLLNIYSSQKKYFNDEEIKTLIQVTDNISYAINALRNETNRKLAEEKNAKLSIALEQSSSSIIITNTDGYIEYVNDAFTSISGYSYEEVIGKRTSILKSGITNQGVYQELWNTLNNNKTWKGVLCNKKKNGELFWESVAISPVFNVQGMVTNYVAVKDNITNTRISENKIRQYINIIEHSNAYIGIADMNGELLYLNINNRRVFEIGDEEIITQIRILDFFTEDSKRIYHTEIVPQTIQNGIWSGELVWKSRSGILIPVIMVVMLHKDLDGNPEFTSATAINIADIKNKEVELHKLNTDLRSLATHLLEVREEERMAIAKEIHDELGQNLTYLKLDLSWIKTHLDADKSIISKRLTQMLSITDETINTSRRLYNSIYPKMIDDIGLLATIKWHIKNYLNNQPINITIHSNIPEELVNCDHAICLVLFRIYQESLTNIIRYASASEVVLNFDVDDLYITMELSDNGVGFDPDAVDTKLHHGLMGMKERVMSLGGTFKIISAIGKGTRKIINIPLTDNNKTT